MNRFARGLSVLVACALVGLGYIACGGNGKTSPPASIGTTGPDSTNGTHDQSTVSTAKSTASPSSANGTRGQLNVSSKKCPENLTKLTAADMVDAFVIVMCHHSQSGDTTDVDTAHEVFPKGDLKFTTLQQYNADGFGTMGLNFSLEVENCPDCPRQFSGQAGLVKNAVGEWQEAGPVQIREDRASYLQTLSRRIKVEFSSTSAAILPGNTTFTLPVTVTGEPATISVRGQVDDGRVIEFTSADPNYSAFSVGPSGDTFPNGTQVKIIAYAFIYNYTQVDWIPLGGG